MANLTLEEPRTNSTPGIKEYPLTLECRVLYRQDQDPLQIPEEIRDRFYPPVNDDPDALIRLDGHTAYIGEITDAYIIR